MGKLLGTSVWALLVLAALWVVTGRTAAFAMRDTAVMTPPPLISLEPRILDVLTGGHRGLYEDFAFIWTLQSLVDPNLVTLDGELVQRELLKVSRHLPEIETFYMLGCFTLAFDLKRPDLCEPITLDGMKAVPASFRIPLTQGFLFFHEMNQPAKGAMYFGVAATRPHSPEFIGRMATKLVDENALDRAELEATVRQLFGDEASSRFAEYLQRSVAAPLPAEGTP